MELDQYLFFRDVGFGGLEPGGGLDLGFRGWRPHRNRARAGRRRAEPSPGMRQLTAHEPDLRTEPRRGRGRKRRRTVEPPRAPHVVRRSTRADERGRLYGDARPSRTTFEFDDPQDRTRGRIRVGLFIAAEIREIGRNPFDDTTPGWERRVAEG
jgi:hypothetical protein